MFADVLDFIGLKGVIADRVLVCLFVQRQAEWLCIQKRTILEKTGRVFV
jgi:hypothetical protein